MSYSYSLKLSYKAATLLMIASLIISLLPIGIPSLFASSNLFQLSSAGVEKDVPFVSSSIDASQHTNPTLTFDYDARRLDANPEPDVLRYGWKAGSTGTENILGSITGIAGDDNSEIGTINITLPPAAQISNLVIFAFSEANTPGESDRVFLTNITVSGTAQPTVTPPPPPPPPTPTTPTCSNQDTLTNTTFDTFALGAVHNQNNWNSSGPFDRQIVSNTFGFTNFGCQSLRVSNSVVSDSFGDQTFAAPIADSVGETIATAGTFPVGTRYNRFEVKFDIASTKTEHQPGMALSVSPDRGDGSRMSHLGFADEPGGIRVTFFDVQGTDPATFTPTNLGLLDRSRTHSITFVVDTIDGPSNDIVKIYINDTLAHTGSSWENYYRFNPEASAEQTPRIMKTLLIRTAGTAAPANQGFGYLFDNVSLRASFIPTPVTDTTPPAVPTGLRWTDSNGVLVPNNGTTTLVGGAASWTANTEADFSRYIYKYWNNIPSSPFKSLQTAWTAGVSGTSLPGVFNQGEGTHYFCVSAVDTAGNESACSEPFTITYSTVIPTGTVTLCKVNQFAEPQAGWRLALLGDTVQTIPVASNGSDFTSNSLSAGSYVVKATGTYVYRTGPNMQADAAFSLRRTSEFSSSLFTNGLWLPSTYWGANSWLSLQINNTPHSFGTVFSPDHTYFASLILPTTGTASFKITDDGYGDNNGSLTATIYRGFTGTTNSNGCVAFENVPYGTYTVDEQMRTGWENISGLGTITVNSPARTLTITNKDESIITGCTNESATNYNSQANRNDGSCIFLPTHVSPANGSTINTNDFFFDWTDTEGAVSYEVQFSQTATVGSNGGFSGSVWPGDFQGVQPTVSQARSVGASGTWYWQVRTVAQNGAKGPWTTPWSVTIDTTPPVVTPPPTPTTLVITAPATNTQSLSGTYTFIAEYKNANPLVTNIQWAIRAGTCAPNTNTRAGNVDGFTTPFTFTPSTGNFTATVDMSTWAPGEYCFVVNPEEPAGIPDLRETRLFTIPAPNPGGNTDLSGGASTTPPEPTPTSTTTVQTQSQNSSTGTRISSFSRGLTPTVLGAATSNPLLGGNTTAPFCGMLIQSYLKLGENNDTWEVTKLQLFLTGQGFFTPVTGVFDTATEASVKAYQARYAEEILVPWVRAGIMPSATPTGYVYRTTRAHINNKICPGSEPIPSL